MLTSLRRLALIIEDSPWDLQENTLGATSQLMALAALTRLTELRLGGAAVSGRYIPLFLTVAR